MVSETCFNTVSGKAGLCLPFMQSTFVPFCYIRKALYQIFAFCRKHSESLYYFKWFGRSSTFPQHTWSITCFS